MTSVFVVLTSFPQHGHTSADMLSFLSNALTGMRSMRVLCAGGPTRCRAVVRCLSAGPVGGGSKLPRLCLKILAVPGRSHHAPQFRGQLPAFPLALITALAVFPLPEEQPVHDTQGPCPHPVPRPSVATGGQGFIRPAAEQRIEKLVNGDQDSFPVCHA